MRGINWKAALAFAAAISLVGGLALGELKTGQKAPDFTITTLDGKDFKLKPLVSKGKEQKAVVAIAFWGTWCPPCRAEAPHLQKLHAKYGKQGLAMIGIAVADAPRMVRRFADDNKLTYTLAVDSSQAPVAAKYGVLDKDGMLHVPQLFIVDGSGTLRYHHLGYAMGSEKTLEREIKELLAEKPKP
ncbi:MAG: TlpA disulfide reductase family protein [Armatimonadota bacterium]|nr:TlpA disulfide reductase family protein [Armatimonadota bacterium]